MDFHYRQWFLLRLYYMVSRRKRKRPANRLIMLKLEGAMPLLVAGFPLSSPWWQTRAGPGFWKEWLIGQQSPFGLDFDDPAAGGDISTTKTPHATCKKWDVFLKEYVQGM